MRSSNPSMRSLMEDPVFRAYMKRPPHLPRNLRTGNPYQIWVNRSGNWGTALRPTYPDAWKVFVHHFKAGKEDGRDVTLVSRRVFFAPPGEWYRVKIRDARATGGWKVQWRWRQMFFWDELDLHWCGRCRRPVFWAPLYDGHHALRKSPAIAEEDNVRCNICGIRYVAMPSVEQMVKMEPMPK
jgi:hypothetical protein